MGGDVCCSPGLSLPAGGKVWPPRRPPAADLPANILVDLPVLPVCGAFRTQLPLMPGHQPSTHPTYTRSKFQSLHSCFVKRASHMGMQAKHCTGVPLFLICHSPREGPPGVRQPGACRSRPKTSEFISAAGWRGSKG
ncbi:hypothetical protein E2C01_037710 [Portunus trituberculatus]|uniref:Uncharacterized protein n=1 Tax=Portunus trituberculatus TaxID=210409 RepID=A0A5B7F8U7_PORTR|nr:hypothetical protein [Portunus trituberculatus]